MESGALDDRSVVNIRCAQRNAVNEDNEVNEIEGNAVNEIDEVNVDESIKSKPFV